jgi:hypothetical protein
MENKRFSILVHFFKTVLEKRIRDKLKRENFIYL